MLEPVRRVACGAVLTVLVVACGGRTEMLDSQGVEYGSNQPGGGAGPTAPHARGGANAAGSNSTTPAGPTAGSAGATVAPSPPSLVDACSKYCTGITSAPCGVGGDENACVASCSGGVSRLSAKCQSIALNAFECLSGIASAPASECAAATRRIEETCAIALSELGLCLRGMSGMPVPTPPPERNNCGHSGTTGPLSCSAKVTCESGRTYSVQCERIDSTQSSCICNQGADGSMPFEVPESVASDACSNALIACAGETLPK